MNTIDAQNAQPNSVRDAFNMSSGREQVSATGKDTGQNASKSNADSTGPDRTVNDTVSLSGDAQKIVNLNRGQSLAEDLRTAPVDAEFAKSLETATSDVFRISELFNKTVRAAFSLWR
ncbi:hypothetical protein V5T82_02500 [Magnetovibrio sp. PR-2]|uniref:hypothetical protein n=1 Tax=Magnetovibrio sp. PR-2 TaxID=3120356 RepID=UPI002FCE5035